MKKWQYKVSCYTYVDSSATWLSVFDKVEGQTIEELIAPLGEEGWELISVTAELAVPMDMPTPIPSYIPARNSGGGILDKIRGVSGDNAGGTQLMLSSSGGFDVKAYRAFFKRKKPGVF
jgi:hypothetical protein